MIVELTKEGDFLLFCAFPGFGNPWIASVGLLLDIIGVLFVSSDLFRMGRAIRQNRAAEDELRRKLSVAETIAALGEVNVRNISNIEMGVFDRKEAENPLGKFFSIVLKGISENKKNASEAKVMASHVGADAAAIRDAVLEFFAETRNENSVRLVATKFGICLIILGFSGQAIGSWPCTMEIVDKALKIMGFNS